MSWRGKVSKNVHQLIFYFCPKNAHSQGVRDFLTTNYSDIKALNPYTGLLVRETPETEPYMMIERHFGAREKKELKDLSTVDIEEIVKAITLEAEKPRDTRAPHQKIADVVTEEYARFNPAIPNRI